MPLLLLTPPVGFEDITTFSTCRRLRRSFGFCAEVLKANIAYIAAYA